MIGRLLGAVGVLLVGLGIVMAAGPLRPDREATPRPVATPERLPAPVSASRGGTANGMPFVYSTSLSKRSPEALIEEFQAEGLESGPDTGLLAPLSALPPSPGFLSAVRWSRASPDAPPMPEVLLVFGRNPASTYRLRLTGPSIESVQYRPLQDLENRLGIFRSGIEISYGVLDADGSFVFLGTDPGRRILSPGFSATMEAAGWRPGVRNESAGQAVSCFSRWSKEVCLSRDESGVLMVSMSPSGYWKN